MKILSKIKTWFYMKYMHAVMHIRSNLCVPVEVIVSPSIDIKLYNSDYDIFTIRNCGKPFIYSTIIPNPDDLTKYLCHTTFTTTYWTMYDKNPGYVAAMVLFTHEYSKLKDELIDDSDRDNIIRFAISGLNMSTLVCLREASNYICHHKQSESYTLLHESLRYLVDGEIQRRLIPVDGKNLIH